jgi:hypothetical protein
MLLPIVFNSLDTTLDVGRIHELLEVNEELREHNLFLVPSDAQAIIVSRGRTLKNQGRIELNIDVTKKLVNKLAQSPYINKDNYVTTVNEMYEIFHFLKNSTSDFSVDDDILDAIIIYFDDVCAGSTELLVGKGIEKILENYKSHRRLTDIVKEEEDGYWNFDEQTGLPL